MWLALMVLLFAGATFLQGYLYSEPAEGMYWRAPAAATLLTLVCALWAYFDYKSIKRPDQAVGSYTSLFAFSPEQSTTYGELWGIHGGKRTHYKLEKSAGGAAEYRDANRRRMPKRVDTIVVKENGEEVHFHADKDAQGNFKVESGRPLRYLAPDGRAMSEDSPGEVSITRPGVVFGNLLLNLVHFVAWFGGFWLVLRFQWHHALGLAVVFWLIMGLVIMPMILSRVEAAARLRAPAPQESVAVERDLAREAA
jgi:hypothetical protein